MKEMFRMVDKSKVDEVKQMLEYTQKGTAKATVGNYMVVLRNDPLVRESMKYNKLTGRIDIVKKRWWNEEICKLDDDGRNALTILTGSRKNSRQMRSVPLWIRRSLAGREPESTDFQRKDMADREAGSGKEQKKRVATNRIKMDLQS